MAASPFSEIPQAPADPILGLTEAFQSDKNPSKVNLGVGVYQDGNGKVPVLKVVPAWNVSPGFAATLAPDAFWIKTDFELAT